MVGRVRVRAGTLMMTLALRLVADLLIRKDTEVEPQCPSSKRWIFLPSSHRLN